MKKLFASIMIFFLVLFSGLGGCTATRKPEKKLTSPKTIQTPSTTPKTTPSTTSERTMADRVTRETVKVSGVKEATVVISGRTAYIGLTLDPNVKKARTTTIKSEVANRAKAAEPSLIKVNVTSDPDLVARLKRISDGIKKGKPVSSFVSELTEIERRITPKTR